MTSPNLSESELERLARELGRRAAERLDPERIAARVRTRLDTEPVIASRRPRWIHWTLGVAAAAALTLAVVSRPERPESAAPGVGLVSLQELDDLSAAELEAVLESIPPASDSAVHVESAPIDELTAAELERVLRTLE